MLNNIYVRKSINLIFQVILTGMRIILIIPWLWDIISKRSLLFNHPDCLLMTFFVLNSKLVEFVWGACNCKKFLWLVPNFSFLSSADYGIKIVYLDLKSNNRSRCYSWIFLIIKKSFSEFLNYRTSRIIPIGDASDDGIT